MVTSRKLLLINFAIILFNVIFGLFIHVVMMSLKSPIRERYVQLPEKVVLNDPQLFDEGRTSGTSIFGNDTSWGGGGGGGAGAGAGGGSGGGCDSYNEPRKPSLDHNRGLLDKSRTFKIHPFAITGSNWTGINVAWDVCLSTQASANLIHWVSKQTETWEGPISVAVFTPDVDYTVAIKMIKYLQACFPEVQSRVTFHMVYPKKFPAKYVDQDDSNLEYDCNQPELVNNELVRTIRTKDLDDMIQRAAYPQNLLRNIAREGCHAEFSFTPDVDMISIPGASKQLNEFVSRKPTRLCEKCAYIIPTYEIHSRVTNNPVNKEELKRLIKRRRAQRFHIKVFSPNQANSKLIKWERFPMSKNIEIAYNITTWQNYWEPIYVAHASVPLYDERFVGYGSTRNSQVFEMHVADFTWHMLNNPFLCHKGFQNRKRKNPIRRSQIKRNAVRYKHFRLEVYTRYGKNQSSYEPKKQASNVKSTKKDVKNPP